MSTTEKETSTVDTIVSAIRHRIAEGKYTAGQKLREVELSKQFEVSRTPIREAFRILESDGLLTSTPRRGVEVAAPLDEGEVADCFYIRRILSREASYLAAQHVDNISPDTKEHILHIHQELKAIAQDKEFDYDRAGRLDFQLHLSIAKASGSKILMQLLEQVTGKLRPMGSKLRFRKERLAESIVEHDNIINAIFAGQAENARDYTGIHFYNSYISNRKKAREYNQHFTGDVLK